MKAGQPALTRAMELQRKASTVGFDWNDPRAVLQKSARKPTRSKPRWTAATPRLAEETGDLLFAVVNLARHVGADPDPALRGTNAKFERRFAYIERALAAQGARSKARRWPRWTRCGTRRRRRNRLHATPRHGVEAVDHDVTLGFIDTHGHVETAVVQLLVEHFGIAMQPADASAVGGVDRQVQRRACRRQPLFDRGEERVDPLLGFGGNQESTDAPTGGAGGDI